MEGCYNNQEIYDIYYDTLKLNDNKVKSINISKYQSLNKSQNMINTINSIYIINNINNKTIHNIKKYSIFDILNEN